MSRSGSSPCLDGIFEAEDGYVSPASYEESEAVKIAFAAAPARC